MPYISKDRREKLDPHIEELRYALIKQISLEDRNGSLFQTTPEQLLELSGDINYCVSRLCAALVCELSYKKIAIITGVLENIKQEFYRRMAEPYENEKIEENGDITEYKRYLARDGGKPLIHQIPKLLEDQRPKLLEET